MIILRQKLNSSIISINEELKNGANAEKRTQDYYNNFNWDEATKGAERLGSNPGVRTLGGDTNFKNPIKKGDIYDIGVKKGRDSVGILGGAKNTWNSLSKNQQIGVAAGGAALAIGAAALLARNRRKRKEAEEELERERRRR